MTPYMHNIHRKKTHTKQVKQLEVDYNKEGRYFKMSTRNNLEVNLQRLESELRNLKQALEDRSIDGDERRRLLYAIRDVEREILSTLRELRDLTELENERMQRAIEAIERMKNK